MSLVKIAEVLGQSDKSWEDAIQQAVNEASRSIPTVTGVEVLNMTADIRDGKIVGYKADLQIAYTE